MLTDNQIFNELKEAFDYLEEWDRLGAKPTKRVQLTISIPIKMKKKLEGINNVSGFVERCIEGNLTNQNMKKFSNNL